MVTYCTHNNIKTAKYIQNTALCIIKLTTARTSNLLTHKASIQHIDKKHKLNSITTNIPHIKTSHLQTSIKIWIYTMTVITYLSTMKVNRQIQATTSPVNKSETSLTKQQRRTLAQFGTNQSPFLHISYTK